MRSEAETVRSLLQWAWRTVHEDEADRTRVPSPGLSQVSLFRMFSRADPTTAASIAWDLNDLQPHRIEAEVQEIIHRDKDNDEPRFRQSRFVVDQVETCERLLVRARGACRSRAEITLLEHGYTLRSWKQMEDHWPGRVWHSLRDDWERIALRIWDRERQLILTVLESFFFTSGENRIKSAKIQTPVHDREERNG